MYGKTERKGAPTCAIIHMANSMSSLNLPVKCYNSFKNKVFTDCYLFFRGPVDAISLSPFSLLHTGKQTASGRDKSGNDKTKIINNLDMVSKLILKKYTVEPPGKDTSLIRTHLYFVTTKFPYIFGQRTRNLDTRE